jgi:hypothetical protein
MEEEDQMTQEMAEQVAAQGPRGPAAPEILGEPVEAA